MLLRFSQCNTALLSKKNTLKNRRKYATKKSTLSTLENGVNILPSTRENKLATVGFSFDAGASYETDSQLGVSRFFEKSLPYVKGVDGKTLSESLNELGGSLKTFSSRDRITVIGQSLGENSEKLVDLLANAVSPGAEVSSADAETVKNSMLAEYDQRSATYDQDFFIEQLHSAAFQGTSLANSVYGSYSTINTLSGDMLKEYKTNNFTGARVAVTSVGINEEKFVKQIGSGPIASLAQGFNEYFTQPDDFVGSEIRIRDDTFPTSIVALGLNSPGRTHNDYYPYLLFQALCGSYDKLSGGGNNIITVLAEDMTKDIQFVDKFETLNHNYKNTGVFTIYAQVPPFYIDDYTTLLGTRLQHIAKSTSEQELKIAKNMVKSAIAFQSSTSAGWVEQAGDDLLTTRKYRTTNDIFNEIDAVTLKQFKLALKERFDDTDPAIVGFGQIEELANYVWFKQKLGSPLW